LDIRLIYLTNKEYVQKCNLRAYSCIVATVVAAQQTQSAFRK